MKIIYKKGYKYQLSSDWVGKSSVIGFVAENEYVKLQSNGMLEIYRGYAWDGPSGPTIDTKTFMRGALLHDALYQLMREGKLPPFCKKSADNDLYNYCRTDGMGRFRAWYVKKTMKLTKFATLPKNKKQIIIAPE